MKLSASGIRWIGDYGIIAVAGLAQKIDSLRYIAGISISKFSPQNIDHLLRTTGSQTAVILSGTWGNIVVACCANDIELAV